MSTTYDKPFLLERIHAAYHNKVLPLARLAADDGALLLEHRTCLLWALATALTFRCFKIPCCMQSGTAAWQLVREEDDDGVSATHFSYTFEPSEALPMFASQGHCEMHVWNYLPDTKELVDMSAQYQAQQAQELMGRTFHPSLEMREPLWVVPAAENGFGSRFYYEPHPLAMRIAESAVREVLELGVEIIRKGKVA